ncbi:MAG: hypothetical protein MZV63_68965 [Marinilabiliales bacterium]|nr:hypothetical protein [Marinilabiliales bacterium]
MGNNLTIAPYTQQNAPNVTYSVYRAQPVLEPYYSDGSYAVVYNVGNPLAQLAYSNDFRKGVRGVGNIFAEATFLDAFHPEDKLWDRRFVQQINQFHTGLYSI